MDEPNKIKLFTLEDLEERVYRDITYARTSYEVIHTILKTIFNGKSCHFETRYTPIKQAIVRACFESTAISLNRLFDNKTEALQCTLEVLVKKTQEKITNQKEKEFISKQSQSCINKFKKDEFFKYFNGKRKKFLKILKPIRDKMIAHSDQNEMLMVTDDNKLSIPIKKAINNFSKMIEFAKNIHQGCTSALEDRAISSPYFDQTLIDLSKEWADALTELDQPKRTSS